MPSSLIQDRAQSSIETMTQFAQVIQCGQSNHKSVYATADFAVGDIFFQLGSREVLDKPNYLTVQIDHDHHILLDPEWLQYINHSCDPNVFLDTKNGEIRVIKPIQSGDEVTFFYPSTEWDMEQPFDCLCNSYNCLHRIEGAKYLPEEVLDTYELSEYIQQKRSQVNL